MMPEITWSDFSEIVRKAWSALMATPTAMPISSPSQGFPVMTVTTKPLSAPPSIMPSTPRLSTPPRSAMISPSDARMSTVDARTVASSSPARKPTIYATSPSARRPRSSSTSTS